MESLPRDILENILCRLPIKSKSTLGCKLVCRTWRTIIGNKVGVLVLFKKVTQQPFIEHHEKSLCYGDPQCESNIEKYYSENTLETLWRFISHWNTLEPLWSFGCTRDFEPNRMVGSCNGLVCLESGGYDMSGSRNHYSLNEYETRHLMCLNPITGEQVAHILGREVPGRSTNPPICGFGYVSSTNEYKVVRIYFDKRGGSYAEVYTLGDHVGWRCKGSVARNFLDFRSGVYANGAVHWINLAGRKIIAFGLADEEFRPVPSPPCDSGFGIHCSFELILLGGNLCVILTDMYNHQSINKRLDIWALKRKLTKNISISYGGKANGGRSKFYYDCTWSWSKEYSIAWEGEFMYTPFVVTKRNTLLLWQNGTSNLCCYDPRTSTLQKYMDGDKDNMYVQAIPYMKSFVSLKDSRQIPCSVI